MTDTKDIDEQNFNLAMFVINPTERKIIHNHYEKLLATQKEQLLDRLEEAIAEDTTDDNLLPELRGTLAGKSFILSRNALRTQLRAVLTKERNQ